MNRLPAGVLLDLDDTILDDSSKVDECWRQACQQHARDIDPLELHAAIDRAAKWYWSDAERHRAGRLDLAEARRYVVRLALKMIGHEDDDLAARVGDMYSRLRDAGMAPIAHAVDTVQWLRAERCRLALLTNGAGPAQRRKIERFQLAPLFDAVLIEGEVGVGKPDPRIYKLALKKLGLRPKDAWMVGDHLIWDVDQPQRMGMRGIWIDRAAKGTGTTGIRPDRIVRGLSDLRDVGTQPPAQRINGRRP